MVFLVVGLGNPGLRYANSRHNAGFMVVEKVAEKTGIGISGRQFDGECGSGFCGETKLILFKPQTFMNNSGEPVRKIMGFYGLNTDAAVVAHDEVDLPVGRIQVKTGGGSAGHNGVKSVAGRIGSGFARLRVGVGRPPAGVDTADYVLSGFTREETGDVEDSVSRAADAVIEMASKGVESVMNRYNTNQKQHNGG